MSRCIKCGSYAINPNQKGRDDSRKDLCDVCYWINKFEEALKTSDKKCKAKYNYLDCDIHHGNIDGCLHCGNFKKDEKI
jgi:hypothetical protein